MFRKNVAGQFIHFQGVDTATGGIKSGVTWTVRRCIDGTFAAATGTVTEDGTTGWYKFAMSQADVNGNNIGFNFTGTGAVPQTVNIVTTALDPTSTAFGLSIAKTTNITGFNDIAATAIVSAGAITTSGGAVSTVTNTTQLNGAATVVLTDASSDAVLADAIWNAATATYGGAGSYGLLVETDLDATISSRMATYTQPTGFLAATFPTDPADESLLEAAIAAVQADTDNIQTRLPTALVGGRMDASVGSNLDKTGYALTADYDFAKGSVAMTEGYAADGATMTPAQVLHMIYSLLAERSVGGTTLTVKKLDGTTTAMTFTLDSATAPTSQTRAT